MTAAIPESARHPAGDRSGRATFITLVVGLMAAGAFLISLATGPTGVGLNDLGRLMAGADIGQQAELVMLKVRLPRALLGALVGAGLAMSGAMMQGLLRNPLADPGIVGVSAGAATAAVAAIVLSAHLSMALPAIAGDLLLPLAAFAGALGTTALLYAISTRRGETSTAMLILAGIAIAAFAGALTGLMIFEADDAMLRDITFWSLGSLGGATFTKVLMVLPFVVLGLILAPLTARGLDALILGENEALHLGVDTQRLKRLVIVAVAAAAGATVAVAGTIGFVGLVVPHLLRLVMGPGHGPLLPASALGGAALVLLADAACRLVVAPAELPIGILMALIGAPAFLFLLLKGAAREGTT